MALHDSNCDCDACMDVHDERLATTKPAQSAAPSAERFCICKAAYLRINESKVCTNSRMPDPNCPIHRESDIYDRARIYFNTVVRALNGDLTEWLGNFAIQEVGRALTARAEAAESALAQARERTIQECAVLLEQAAKRVTQTGPITELAKDSLLIAAQEIRRLTSSASAKGE